MMFIRIGGDLFERRSIRFEEDRQPSFRNSPTPIFALWYIYPYQTARKESMYLFLGFLRLIPLLIKWLDGMRTGLIRLRIRDGRLEILRKTIRLRGKVKLVGFCLIGRVKVHEGSIATIC